MGSLSDWHSHNPIPLASSVNKKQNEEGMYTSAEKPLSQKLLLFGNLKVLLIKQD